MSYTFVMILTFVFLKYWIQIASLCYTTPCRIYIKIYFPLQIHSDIYILSYLLIYFLFLYSSMKSFDDIILYLPFLSMYFIRTISKSSFSSILDTTSITTLCIPVIKSSFAKHVISTYIFSCYSSF